MNASATESVSAPGPAEPPWLDRTLYPFESHFLTLPEGRVHYVDEGPRTGTTLLCLHGNPTWSFLYRDVIASLSEEIRVVAPDLLGFGLSDKPADFSYLPRDHARVFERVVDDLGLDDVVLVVHDWGGPIGLDWATRHPDRVRGVVVTNSWMWPHDSTRVRLFGRFLGGMLGREAILRFNAFARVVVPLSFADRSRLSPAVHRHYVAPLSTPEKRKGSWVFPRELLGSSVWLGDLWTRRGALADVPVLLVWGLDDPAFGGELDRWQRAFPRVRTVPLDGCGHYVAEEHGRELAAAIDGFLTTL
ncbi:alpha/beta fold hydrolase [Salinigranum sp. GCM10025319]|uniref:alpha/beta fold hydrolase n=1 Tax=Salinigranum sp. GCM10025319 TaxID=3252687 RepID=UPI0036103E07